FCHWPDRACLACAGLIDGTKVAATLRSDSERSAHEAVYGVETPAPSVVTINGLAASLAAGEFLKFATGWAKPSTFLAFDAARGTVESIEVQQRSDCPMCAWHSLEEPVGDGAEFELSVPL